MSKVETVEKNKVKITFTVSPEKFEEGMKASFEKNKGYFNISGFRKGKAPRKLIEAQYGKEVFYDDAINFILPEAYEMAVKENNLEVVSRPEIDFKDIEAGKDIEFTAVVYTKPEVVISKDDYVGVKYTKKTNRITEKDILAEIDKVREQNARMIQITDRPVQNGDIATIDFEGFMDGVAFAGGKGKDYDLEIGSHSFIDNFEDQIIGHEVGDDIDVNVTFPAEYGQADLAGKPALFKVEVKDIKAKELPELNDEFASDVSEFDTLDEYKKDVKAKLSDAKQKQIDNEKEEEIITALVEKAEMDVPQVMIENDIDNKVNEFSTNIQRQGLSLEMYLQYMGQTVETMREAYRPMSEKQVKARLVLEAVAKNENFEATDEELDKEVENIATNYHMELDKFKSVLRDEDIVNLKKDIVVQKALKFVVEKAVEGKK